MFLISDALRWFNSASQATVLDRAFIPLKAISDKASCLLNENDIIIVLRCGPSAST